MSTTSYTNKVIIISGLYLGTIYNNVYLQTISILYILW